MTEPHEPIKILLLGATGYIGGSILTELLERNTSNKYTISALVRKPYQASILADAGVLPLIFKDLDDVEVVREAARESDVVIAAASARHGECARACIKGLGERKRSTGRDVHYIHTSGTSNVGDWPITGTRSDTSIHSDVDEDIFELEGKNPEAYGPVRSVDQLVIEVGEEEGVRTYIVAPPLIYGPGTGSFTLGYGQLHMVIQLSLNHRQAVMMGSGSGIWNRIHILDLTHLFSLLLDSIISSNSLLPHGKKGFYFAENGFQSWKSIAEKIGKAGKELGTFETEEVAGVELQEVAEVCFEGDERHAESVLGSNSRTKADLARKVLEWKPERGEETFEKEIFDVFSAMVDERAGRM